MSWYYWLITLKQFCYLIQAKPNRIFTKIYFNLSFPGETTRKRLHTNTIMLSEIPVWIKNLDSKNDDASPKFKINNSNKKFKIARITQFDDRINAFWNDVSRHFSIIVERKKEYLNWRYQKKPDSHLFNILLAEEDDTILGYVVGYSHPKDDQGHIIDLLSIRTDLTSLKI